MASKRASHNATQPLADVQDVLRSAMSELEDAAAGERARQEDERKGRQEDATGALTDAVDRIRGAAGELGGAAKDTDLTALRSAKDHLRAMEDELRYAENANRNHFGRVCFECKRPIHGTFIEHMDRFWHSDHFNCSQCNINLRPPRQFHISDEDVLAVFCTRCWGRRSRHVCGGCGKDVEEGSGVMVWDQPFHRECFRCTKCEKVISGQFAPAPDAAGTPNRYWCEGCVRAR